LKKNNNKQFSPEKLFGFITINRSVRRENLQLVIREIVTSIGHKSENVKVT